MARDARRYGKDPRDVRRKKTARPGGSAHGVIAGTRGTIDAVREEKDRAGTVRKTITEERYNLDVPQALRNRVRSVFVKQNRIETPGSDTVRGGRVLVITFREPQNGITGLPVSTAEERRLRKLAFVHVTIEFLPLEIRDAAAGPYLGGYDERAFRITWWKPRSGHRHEHEKGGEVVHGICDELSVLAWLSENDLGTLYEIPRAVKDRLLPMRDEDRDRENALALGLVPRAPKSFPRERLGARLASLSTQNDTYAGGINI